MGIFFYRVLETLVNYRQRCIKYNINKNKNVPHYVMIPDN